MDLLQLDYWHGWAMTIWLMAWLSVAVVPLVAGVRAGRPLVLLRGALLSVTGSLFLVRAESSLQRAAQAFLADLHPTLPPALMLAVLVLVWVGIWTVVLAQLGDAVAGAPSAWSALPWAALGGLSIYFAVFVLGGLPGALAHGFSDQGRHESQSQRAYTGELTAARKANAVALCSHAGEALRLLNSRPIQSDRVRRAKAEVISVGRRWAVDMAGQAAACSAQAEKLTLVQAQAVVAEMGNVLRRISQGMVPAAPNWTAEPKAVAQDAALAQMGLGKYFAAALWTPWVHVARLFSELDLAVTFVLMGELAAAVLWLLDVCLQRRVGGGRTAPAAAPDPGFITDR